MTHTSPDARAISAQILAIERGLNLNSSNWVVENTHLWPLYRLELKRLMFVNQAKQQGKRASRPELAAAFRRCKTPSNTTGGNSNIWLVSDGFSFSTLGDTDFERFCNPIFDALCELGHSSVIIDRASRQPRKTTIPTRWWAPITQRAKLLGILRAVITPDARHQWIIDQIVSIATKADIKLPQLSAKRFNAMSNAVLSLASKIEGKMRCEHVKAVFVVGYYDVGGYAYVLAANRANLTCVDIQHGVTGELHTAYANWNFQPSAGLTLLPKIFLCWTQEDARVVRQWADKHHGTKSHAIVSGHPFLEAWKQGSIPLPEQTKNTIKRIIMQSEGRPIVLVTLQPNLCSPKSLAPLLKTWIEKPNVTWWIRTHPLAQCDRDNIESLLKQYQVHHFNVDEASSLPLPALLQQSTIHATHSSSTVIEAELLGVPSLIWSEYGEQLFETQILRGTATRIAGGEDFINKLNKVGNQQKIPSTNDSSNQLGKALKEILETTK